MGKIALNAVYCKKAGQIDHALTTNLYISGYNTVLLNKKIYISAYLSMFINLNAEMWSSTS